MNKANARYRHYSITGALIIIVFLSTTTDFQPTPPWIIPTAPTNNTQIGTPASYSPAEYFYLPTSGIRILVVSDLSTGADNYAEGWKSLLGGYGYSVSLLSLQQILSNPILSNDYDLVLADHSCGGDQGSEISFAEAEGLIELGKPLVLLGGAHGVIDRITNYTGEFGYIEVAGAIQKEPGQIDQTIYSSPFAVIEVGYGASGSIEVLAQSETLESYPENVVQCLHPFAVLEGAARPIVGALYSSKGNAGRLFWWAFEDPDKLNANGRNLFVNTVEWMGGFTNLQLLIDFLENLEILDKSVSTYFAGGYGDYFEPQIQPTFYAYESLRLAGKVSAISASALVNWLAVYCYSTSEGCFRSPNRYLSPIYWSGVVETGMALRILSDLEALDKVDSSRISTYIKSCQLGSGFAGYPGDPSVSLTNTYWAIIGLNSTGLLSEIDKIGATNYILSCQNQDPEDKVNYGGFGDHPGEPSFARYTLMALASLKLLDAIGSINQTIVEQWLMDGYVASKGIFYDEHVSHQRHTVNYGTGYAIASLSILGKLQNVDRTCVSNYLSSVQFTDGGWSGANLTDEPIDEVVDCYPVILGLSQLDRIDAIKDPVGFIGFLMRCLSPAPTYGFSNLPRTTSNLWQTNDAVAILDDLGIMYSWKVARLNASIIASYDPDSARFEWIRYSFPLSQDGYGYANVEQPFEFTTLQRGKRGVIMTDLAVTSLVKLGSTNWVRAHAKDLWNEIARCEVVSGPYAGYYKRLSGDAATNMTAGLRYTYHALNCLWVLAVLNYTPGFPNQLAGAPATINRIMSLYDPLTGSFRDGDYVLEPYSQIETTAIALASLSLLDGLSNINYSRTAEFLQSNMYSSLVDAYYSFQGLQLLGRLSSINSTRLADFILSCQRQSGAFKSSDTEHYRLESTRMALEVLGYYNITWIAAKPIGLLASTIDVPTSMNQGSNYLVNLTLVDSRFMLPVTGASPELMFGTYQYTMSEASQGSGQYTANILVPFDRTLLGVQDLSIRCSKDTYQTSFDQIAIEILPAAGGNEGEFWINVLLEALATPLGAGLVITASGLLITAYFMRSKRREPEAAETHTHMQNEISRPIIGLENVSD